MTSTVKAAREVIRRVKVVERSIANILLSLNRGGNLNKDLDAGRSGRRDISSNIFINGVAIINEQSTLKSGTISANTSTT